MLKIFIAMLFLAASPFALAQHDHHDHESVGTSTPPPMPTRSAEQLKHDQGELFNDVRETLNRSIQQNIDNAKQTAAELRARSKTKLAAEIDEKSKALESKLGEIRGASTQKWHQLKSRIEKASADLHDTVKKAKAALK